MSPKSGMARRDTGSDRQAAVMPPSDLDLGQDLALDLGDDHASRVQTLLVSVRDLASSLYRLSAQLEREIGPSRPGTPPPGEQAAAAQELLRLRAEVAQLRGSIEARVVIEQAKGMLMADRGCSDVLFDIDILRAVDQNVTDLGILQYQFKWSKAESFVEHFVDDPVAFTAIK